MEVFLEDGDLDWWTYKKVERALMESLERRPR